MSRLPDALAPCQQRCRVAFLTHGFFPSVGGSEVTLELAVEAVGAHVPTCVLTSTLCLEPARQSSLRGVHAKVRLGELEVDVRYLPSIYLLREKFMLPSAALPCLASVRPRVVVTSHPSASALVGGLYCRVTGARWYAIFHADVAEDRLARRLFTRFEALALRLADVVHVTSHKYAERLALRGINPQRIVVIPGITRADRLGSVGRKGLEVTPITCTPDHPFLFVGALDAVHQVQAARGPTPGRRSAQGEGPQCPHGLRW